MKIGSNRNINRNHKKLTPLDVPNTVIPAARLDPVGTTGEKLAITLLIVGNDLIAYYFW